MPVWLPLAALSANAADTWLGGHVTTGVQGVGPTAGELAPGTVLSQVELDLRIEDRETSFRLDLDYHLDPWWFGAPNRGYTLAPHYPVPPEVAVLQLGQGEGSFVRMGVTNPAYGFEEWDERDNYFASYSEAWALFGSQNIGLEPGWRAADGSELVGFLGYDPAWQSPTFGACVTSEDPRFGTWSGLFWLPVPAIAQAVAANEVTASSWSRIALELHGGVAGRGLFGGGQMILEVHPPGARQPVAGAVRAELRYADQAAVRRTGVQSDRAAVSAALRSEPVPGWLRVIAEVKESWPMSGDSYLTATLLLSVSAGPEPSDPYGVDPQHADDEVDSGVGL